MTKFSITKSKKIIITFVVFSLSTFYFLLSTSNVFAADYSKGLVPCGPDSDCTWAMLYTLAGRIINFMVEIAFSLVAIMIVYGGFVVMTAGDNSGRLQEGWNVIKAAAIGLVITLLGWTITSIVIQALCGGGYGFQPWKMIEKCGAPKSVPGVSDVAPGSSTSTSGGNSLPTTPSNTPTIQP